MLLEFSVANFRSIGEEQTLYMQPAIKSKKDDNYNILQTGIKREPEALPCVAILGANASGKSNILKALSSLKEIIQTSALRQKDDLFEDNRFRLNPIYTNKPTCFRTKFTAINGHMYQYWLELVPEKIIREKLTVIPNTKGAREVILINRKQNKIDLHRSIHPQKKFLDMWKAEINNQQTALAYLDNKGEISTFKDITTWFNRLLISHTANFPSLITANVVNSKVIEKEQIISLLKSADINIHDISFKKKNNSKKNTPIEEYVLNSPDKWFNSLLTTNFIHLDIHGNKTSLDLQNEESNGTQTIFNISSSIIMSLKMGTQLILDEFNSALHPYLVRKIIQLFTNKETNPNGAQLIFATHDVTVMDKTLLRPDEIYFTEKDKETFETRLFSLSEFKGVGSVAKNDRGQKLYKDYLDGRFGAVPEVDWDGGL
ncbi:AAA family ATPase [Desulfovibrio gilichinskyi]|uniref:ATPase AAA-type core domain-containing protein n=1 Tax=Desulfovibrio gilichinskyi TaxID=1519643 RepID=A0A1X7DMP7_9BACT|nr:ATP-binding protein [Desulfovibrio gilichinskyi]SMF18410.1 hypothetical protein SAMN06295933_2081 [Desulfovibrio gilichinskyi]